LHSPRGAPQPATLLSPTSTPKAPLQNPSGCRPLGRHRRRVCSIDPPITTPTPRAALTPTGAAGERTGRRSGSVANRPLLQTSSRLGGLGFRPISPRGRVDDLTDIREIRKGRVGATHTQAQEGLRIPAGAGPRNPALDGLRAAGSTVNCPLMTLGQAAVAAALRFLRHAAPSGDGPAALCPGLGPPSRPTRAVGPGDGARSRRRRQCE
jgi:hypothetical protein